MNCNPRSLLATLFRLLPAVALALAVNVGAAATGPDVQVVTLGTGGGPALRVERAQTSNAVIVDKDVYLVDSADGVLRQIRAARIPIERIKAIFITHHHFDHNAGLGPLIAHRWLVGNHSALPVLGPPMTSQMVKHLARAYRAMELAPITIGGPQTPPIISTVDVRELPANPMEPVVIYRDENVTVSTVLNDHYHFAEGSPEQKASRSYAFRFEAPGRSIVFTGDTGPSSRIERLARGADVLVAEVIDLPRIEASLRANPRDGFPIDELIEHLRQDHLSPTQVGEMAARANVKMVVLSHIVPGWDGETDLSGYTRGIDAHFKGPVHLARDLDRY